MLDPAKYRAIERRLGRYPPPVSARRALSLLERLRLPRDGALLEVGCGTGGLLCDAVAAHGCSATGLESNPELAALARRNVAREGHDGRIEILTQSLGEYRPAGRFDAMLALGAGDACPAPAHVASTALDWLRGGGILVLGTPFLRRTPAGRDRDLLGQRLGRDAEALERAGGAARSIVAVGFELLATAVLSEAEWDAYEGASYRALVAYCAAHGEDPEAGLIRARAEEWYQGYWRFGRDTLGFGVHFFGRPRRALRVVA